MKRLITFVLTALTAVCLCACSAPGKDKSTSPNGLNSRFQAAVTVTIEDLTAEGILKRFGDGMWDVEFSSPNTLSGVKISFSDGNVTASYKGLNFSVPQSALPVKAMMLNLISAADDLAKNEELTGVSEDGMTKISGSLDGGDYTLTVDKSGNISSFEMPNNKLKITFSDIIPISEGAADGSDESQPETDPPVQEETTEAPTETETASAA